MATALSWCISEALEEGLAMRIKRSMFFTSCAGAMLSLAAPAPALAAAAPADFPARPIRFVVPFGAGGTSDIIGRILSARMGDGLAQRLVIDNRGGAGGAIGTD